MCFEGLTQWKEGWEFNVPLKWDFWYERSSVSVNRQGGEVAEVPDSAEYP